MARSSSITPCKPPAPPLGCVRLTAPYPAGPPNSSSSVAQSQPTWTSTAARRSSTRWSQAGEPRRCERRLKLPQDRELRLHQRRKGSVSVLLEVPEWPGCPCKLHVGSMRSPGEAHRAHSCVDVSGPASQAAAWAGTGWCWPSSAPYAFTWNDGNGDCLRWLPDGQPEWAVSNAFLFMDALTSASGERLRAVRRG